MSRSMNDILSDKPLASDPLPESETPPAEEAAPAQEAKPDSETPTEAAPKVETKAQDTDEEDEGPVPDDLAGLKRALAAARGDKRKARKKWQEAERALAEHQGRLAALQQIRQQPITPQEPQQPKASEEFDWTNPIATVEKLVQTRLEAARATERQQRFFEEQTELAQEHDDYREAVAAFEQAALNNPAMQQSFVQSSRPARYAYNTGRQLLALQKRGATTVEELEAKIRAEVKAEFEAQHQALQQQPAPQRQQVVPPKPSIAGARGSGPGVPLQWTGPRPLAEIFGH